MRAELFGVWLDLLTMDETVARCVQAIESGVPTQHVVLNAGKAVLMEDVPGIREVIAECDIANADGQSIVWAGRLLGVGIPERVAGIDLMERLIAEAEARQWPVYFLGARRETLDSFIARVSIRYPCLDIAGYSNGYFDDQTAAAHAVRAAGARLLFVGISSPLKEFFLAEHIADMGPVFAMGVGGSFDVVAGITVRAPLWMQRNGLEWFYRFLQEPRRMWKRYLVGNARFVALVIREWWRTRGQAPRLRP